MFSLLALILCGIVSSILGATLALTAKWFKRELADAAAYVCSNVGLLLVYTSMYFDRQYAAAWFCSVHKACLDNGVNSDRSRQLAVKFMNDAFHGVLKTPVEVPATDWGKELLARKVRC